MKLYFEINNDLDNIRLTSHNACHLFGALIMAYFLGFCWSYGVWIAWEIGDGWKPWYYAAPIYIRYAKFPSWRWLIKNTLYSDKFSLQDALIWDLAGALIGAGLRLLLPI